jgi:nitrogen fixation protein NifX
MSSIRVAVASTDGIDIDQSLKQTSCFRIYDVEPDGFNFVEFRESRELPADPAVGVFTGRVGRILEEISDCSILLVRDIGVCWGKLRIDWVTVYEAPMPVRKALAKLSESVLFRRELNWPARAQPQSEEAYSSGIRKVISIADQR